MDNEVTEPLCLPDYDANKVLKRLDAYENRLKRFLVRAFLVLLAVVISRLSYNYGYSKGVTDCVAYMNQK